MFVPFKVMRIAEQGRPHQPPVGLPLAAPPLYLSGISTPDVGFICSLALALCWLVPALFGRGPPFFRQLYAVVGPEPEDGFPWEERARWRAPRGFMHIALSLWALDASTFGLAYVAPPRLLAALYDAVGRWFPTYQGPPGIALAIALGAWRGRGRVLVLSRSQRFARPA